MQTRAVDGVLEAIEAEPSSTLRSQRVEALIRAASELPPRPPDPRRPAARARAAAADLRQRARRRAAREGRRTCATRRCRACARCASRPGGDRVPRYLLQLHADQKHALVVDSRRSRLYVFENAQRPPAARRRLLRDARQERHRQDARGRPEDAGRRLPRDRQPAAQEAHRLLRRRRLPDQLPERVGQAAQGRNGYGIWLHGTPSDTYSRPPRASDGCIVLANPDLESVGRTLQVGLTPVIISDEIEWTDAAAHRGRAQRRSPGARGLARRLGKPRHRALPRALLGALRLRRGRTSPSGPRTSAR